MAPFTAAATHRLLSWPPQTRRTVYDFGHRIEAFPGSCDLSSTRLAERRGERRESATSDRRDELGFPHAARDRAYSSRFQQPCPCHRLPLPPFRSAVRL